MTIARITGFTAAALGFIAWTCGALAADPTGTWLTEGGKSRVRVADCGGALCGTIVGLKEPIDPATGQAKTDKNNADAGKRDRPVVGIAIMVNMKPNGANKWTGDGYSPEEGKSFSGTFTEQGPNSARGTLRQRPPSASAQRMPSISKRWSFHWPPQ